MQFLKYLLVSPIIKLAWAVVFAPVLVINKSFRDDFRQQKFFTEKIETMSTISFKMRAKIEI